LVGVAGTTRSRASPDQGNGKPGLAFLVTDRLSRPRVGNVKKNDPAPIEPVTLQ
jgi:hypothetical protein